MAESVLADEVAELRSHALELVDRSEIADLVSRLGLWLDEKRFDEAPSIFTKEGDGRHSWRFRARHRSPGRASPPEP